MIVHKIILNCPHIDIYPGSNLILVQDNALIHKATVTQEAVQCYWIPIIDWPANSPDFNNINLI